MRVPEEVSRPAEINVVPLIDIIFCIMVVFIVASTALTRSQGLNVNLPQASSARERLQPDATVSITQTGQIAVNRQPVELNQLIPTIQKIIKEKPKVAGKGPLVVINADLALTHGKVVDVMDALQNLPNVSLAIAAKRR